MDDTTTTEATQERTDHMSTEQGADAPAVDVDAIERLAKASEQGPWTYDFELSYVHNSIGQPILELLCDNDGQVHNPTGQFIAACDPPTVLAMVKRCRDAESNSFAAGEQAGLRVQSLLMAEAENRRLREALSAIIRANETRDDIKCWWECRCGWNYTHKPGRHADGCPVPAAEKALALSGEARDNGGDEVALTNAGKSAENEISNDIDGNSASRCTCLKRGYSGSGHMPGCRAKGAPR